MGKMKKYAKFFNALFRFVNALIYFIMALVAVVAIFTLFSPIRFSPVLIIETIVILVITEIMLYLGTKLMELFISAIKNVQEGRPFEKGVADMFHQRGILTLIIGVMPLFIMAISLLTAGTRRSLTPGTMAGLNSASSAINVKLDIRFNLNFIITAITFFFVECILRYAEDLQTQVDETL